ncbi:MAG: HEAT repeat domain-containing protein [Planctomycetes bacterium]|nr:HEAT repeat domain-containing protein [Planctomycetota bacterium]
MSKRRQADDDDLGFRTPTKKPKTKRRSREKEGRDSEGRKKERSSRKEGGERPSKRKTGAHERPKKRKTGAHERPKKRKTGEHERPSKRKTGAHERPKKRKTGEHERPSKRKTGAHERPTKSETSKAERPKRKTGEHAAIAETKPSSEGGGNKALVMAAGLGAVVIGGLAIMLLMAEPPPKKAKIKTVPIVAASQVAVQPTVGLPPPVARATPTRLIEPPRPKATPKAVPTPAPSKPAFRPGKTLAELAKRSATHAAVAQLLEEHMAIFDPAALRAPGPNRQPFHERRRKEKELLERLRGMGPFAVDAIKEMLVELRNRHQQIFLGKALAGIEGPEAADAVVEVLGLVKDMSIQLSVTRSLPETPDSAGLLQRAFGSEEDPNLRSMLMREYNRRLSNDDPGDLFRDAARDPDQRVRAEAVSILGRRRRPEDATLLEEIIRDEENVNIRKRAIVSYAQTGGKNSLGYLDTILRDPGSAVDVRASAVLGISLVGGQEAIGILEQVAAGDPDQNIKTRATRAANNLRRNMERANSQDEVKAPPVRIGPQAEPLERR